MAKYLNTPSLLGYCLVATVFVFSDLLNDLHVFTGPIFGGQLYHEISSPLTLNTQEASTTKCFENLGCFGIDSGFYDSTYRPVNVLPMEREHINTRFLLFTRKDVNRAHQIRTSDLQSIRMAPVRGNRLTKIIVHGWIDDIERTEWMNSMKNALLENSDVNVIIVDWSGGNRLPYTQATANTRVVGAEIAYLLQILRITKGVTPESCHIIGHSLGAHIGGYVGQRTERLGRITALDPALPYFQHMPVNIRLDSEDALYVDVWHTDATSILRLSLGATQLLGHVDFFPNNGKEQPGCFSATNPFSLQSDIFEGLKDYFACNHVRSIKLFTDSIKSTGRKHVAYSCDNWEDYLQGKCSDCGIDGSKCALMDYEVDPVQFQLAIKNKTRKHDQKFFVKTGAVQPYSLYHYKVAVKLHGNGTSETETGRLILNIKTNNGRQESILLGESEEVFEENKVYNYLVTTETELKFLKNVDIYWKSSSWLSNDKKIHIYDLRLSPLSRRHSRDKYAKTLRFCGDHRYAVYAEEKFTLEAC